MAGNSGAAHPEFLKLVAFDAEDLSVISAHVQDAETQAANIAYVAASECGNVNAHAHSVRRAFRPCHKSQLDWV